MKAFIQRLFGHVRGSNRVSLWARKHLEKLPIKQLLGVNLAGLAFAVAIVVPQTASAYSTWEVSHEEPPVTVLAGPTEPDTQWPLKLFGISQYFSYVHPGMDLTAPYETPVYPIANGTVSWIGHLTWGYGNHVFIKHNDHLQSLYAHFTKVLVTEGQKVTKDTVIGLVGATGWATGNHVHLEVYQDGISVNPLEVLPDIQQ